MAFDREELISVLSDAQRALARTDTIPGLDHFWFDGNYVYAYDGGLGIRIAYETDLECGLPGRPLLDLLKTSALKEIDLTTTKEGVVLQLGKSRGTNLVSKDLDRNPWPEAWGAKIKNLAGTVKLTEDLLEGITRVGFVRLVGKPTENIHHGITVVPTKDALELYATDSASMARMVVHEKGSKDLPRFILPWRFVDQALELMPPGAEISVTDDSLIVQGKDTLLCCNLIELPDEPDPKKTMAFHLRDDEDVVTDVPAGLAALLDRVSILANGGDGVVKLSVKGKELTLEGEYKLGHIDEAVPLKDKLEPGTINVRGPLLRRALGRVKVMLFTKDALALDDDGDFTYVQAHHFMPNKTRKKAEAEDEEGDEKPRRSNRRSKELDDEIPF